LSFYGGTSGQIRSQGGDDEVRLQGIFGGQVHVDGGTGNDLIDLTGIRAHPEAVRALGGDGADLLIGSVNADQLTGGSGSDVLIGRLGADVLIGGVADGADDALDWVDYAAGAAGFRSR
jgi:Ca2+-binding RTX toxin-like protein